MNNMEKSVANDRNFLYTVISYFVVLAIFLNLNSIQSPLVGLIAFVSYFAINAVFLGNAFFVKRNTFFRLVFGVLLLIMLLGFVGWLIMIIHNLDVTKLAAVLVITTTLSSLSNRRMKPKNADC